MSKRQVRLFANDGAWSSAALVMALGTASVMAQSTGATVDGTVKDNSGAPVAGATVTIVAGGFKTYEQNGIVLEVGQHATQNVAMQLGKVQETLTVHSDVAGLDTVASTVSDEVNGHSLRNLPLNTRNPYGLAALVPGFQGSTGDDYNSNSVSIDGGRQGYTDTLVDGTPVGFPTVNGNSGVGVIPSVDAIGEYRVQAQNYAAE
jgi:hypothetical protein